LKRIQVKLLVNIFQVELDHDDTRLNLNLELDPVDLSKITFIASFFSLKVLDGLLHSLKNLRVKVLQTLIRKIG
jgi:hypothetical protein